MKVARAVHESGTCRVFNIHIHKSLVSTKILGPHTLAECSSWSVLCGWIYGLGHRRFHCHTHEIGRRFHHMIAYHGLHVLLQSVLHAQTQDTSILAKHECHKQPHTLTMQRTTEEWDTSSYRHFINNDSKDVPGFFGIVAFMQLLSQDNWELLQSVCARSTSRYSNLCMCILWVSARDLLYWIVLGAKLAH